MCQYIVAALLHIWNITSSTSGHSRDLSSSLHTWPLNQVKKIFSLLGSKVEYMVKKMELERGCGWGYTTHTCTHTHTQRYQKEDIYMVSALSDSMLREWVMPRFLLCGGYTTHLMYVYIWWVISKETLHKAIITRPSMSSHSLPDSPQGVNCKGLISMINPLITKTYVGVGAEKQKQGRYSHKAVCSHGNLQSQLQAFRQLVIPVPWLQVQQWRDQVSASHWLLWELPLPCQWEKGLRAHWTSVLNCHWTWAQPIGLLSHRRGPVGRVGCVLCTCLLCVHCWLIERLFDIA